MVGSMSLYIYQNLFASFGTFGERIINAYERVGTFYTQEYLKAGGHHGDCTLVYEGEIRRLIHGKGKYGRCERFADQWLNDLKNLHVKKLGYRIGFVNEKAVPQDIRFNLLNADSIILVGTTLSVRRSNGTLALQFITGGEQLRKDQRHLRELADHYADFSPSGICRKIEVFQREIEGPSRTSTLD